MFHNSGGWGVHQNNYLLRKNDFVSSR